MPEALLSFGPFWLMFKPYRMLWGKRRAIGLVFWTGR